MRPNEQEMEFVGAQGLVDDNVKSCAWGLGFYDKDTIRGPFD